MCQDLGWDTLQQRRGHVRLSMMCRIVHHMVGIPAKPYFTALLIRIKGHYTRSRQTPTAFSGYQHSFSRTIVLWNQLQAAVNQSPPSWTSCPPSSSLEAFQNQLSTLATNQPHVFNLAILTCLYCTCFYQWRMGESHTHCENTQFWGRQIPKTDFGIVQGENTVLFCFSNDIKYFIKIFLKERSVGSKRYKKRI